jgi:predicted secreted protein
MTTLAVATGQNMTLTVEGAALGWSKTITLNDSQGVIDVTSRSSAQWGESLAGRREWTIDFDGFFIYNSVSKKVLFDHFNTHVPATISAIITMPDSSTYTGECLVESLTLDGNFEDAITCSGSLRGTGALAASVS